MTPPIRTLWKSGGWKAKDVWVEEGNEGQPERNTRGVPGEAPAVPSSCESWTWTPNRGGGGGRTLPPPRTKPGAEVAPVTLAPNGRSCSGTWPRTGPAEGPRETWNYHSFYFRKNNDKKSGYLVNK